MFVISYFSGLSSSFFYAVYAQRRGEGKVTETTHLNIQVDIHVVDALPVVGTVLRDRDNLILRKRSQIGYGRFRWHADDLVSRKPERCLQADEDVLKNILKKVILDLICIDLVCKLIYRCLLQDKKLEVGVCRRSRPNLMKHLG